MRDKKQYELKNILKHLFIIRKEEDKTWKTKIKEHTP